MTSTERRTLRRGGRIVTRRLFLGIGSFLFAASSLFNVARSQDDPQKATPATTATPSATAPPDADGLTYDVKLMGKGSVVSATVPLQNFTIPESNMHRAFVEDAEHVKNAAWLSMTGPDCK